MAAPPPPLTLIILLIFITVLNADGVVSSPIGSGDPKRPPMIIPLHLTIPNASAGAHRNSPNFRHLQNSDLPTARMRLFDDLLANGYYTTRLHIGTPPQEFALIVDTGSTVTYVPCSTCEKCGDHQDPRFQPDLSSTYQVVKCNPDCDCDEEGKQCTYERRYAEQSSSSGVIAEDVVSFGNESVLPPQRAVFGCENVETGDIYSQRADGIMGLGRGRLSIVDQLVEKNVIGNSFSLCYGGMDIGGGAMVLGEITPPADMVFTHSDPRRSAYYNIALKELHVGGKPLKLDHKVFDGKYGTVLDSGTTYAYLPEEAFFAFKDAIMKEITVLKQIHGPDPNYNDICFSGAGRDVSQLSKSFPQVDMVFGNGQKLSLSPENYLFRLNETLHPESCLFRPVTCLKHTKVSGAYCLGIFQNVDPTTLLGGIIVRNTLVTYDREDDKIGFLKTNCSDLWKRLQAPGAPTAPAVEPGANTSQALPPALPPSTLPTDVFPGELRIGDITFDVLISINKSFAVPNFTEVAEFIAHELGVNDLQVHMLNFTTEGDNYHVRWRIFPIESSDYISNTTAMDIILRLQEHRVKFPESLGSYQLLEWKIDEKKSVTWWQRHALALAIVGIVSLVSVLLAVTMLLAWRQRQGRHGSYEAVDAVVAEQELQSLSSN